MRLVQAAFSSVSIALSGFAAPEWAPSPPLTPDSVSPRASGAIFFMCISAVSTVPAGFESGLVLLSPSLWSSCLCNGQR